MSKQKKSLPVVSPEASYGELRKALPTPNPGKKPTITKLQKYYTVILQKTTECCTLEVFDCGFCLCSREKKYKIFSVELCKVLKSAFYSDGSILPEEMEIDDLPWWVPLEMAGINRLACVYDKSTGLWFNITHNELGEYNRYRNSIRRKEQYHHRCKCPRSKWWLCDGICQDCEFHIEKELISLNATWTNDCGDEVPLLDSIACSESDPGETIPAKLMAQRLLERLSELMPEASEIGRLRLLGMKDEDIAYAIGINRTAFYARIEKARDILREEFGQDFDF